MVWFKVDDKLHDHRKARAASTEAIGLWTLAGSWCSDNLTDGFVPCSVLPRWGPKWRQYATRLVQAGLWVEATKDGERGYQFHQWSDEGRQPTREQVERERAAARNRMQRARSKNTAPSSPEGTGDVRANTERSNGVSSTTPTRPDLRTPLQPPPPARRAPRPSTTDQRVSQALALAAELRQERDPR
jgi:hypothetical protein